MREGIKGFMQNDFTKYFLDDGLYVIEDHVLVMIVFRVIT